MKKNILTAVLLGATLGAGAVTPLWLRDVRISPDGSKIAFTYKGDIYTVPVAGGEATRLTTQPSYETEPIWSPDGTKIAFASDREGGNDVFIMDSKGGEATRLTYNSAAELPNTFTPDGKSVIYSAVIQDAPSALLFPATWQTELYSVPVTGGRPKQLLSTPAEAISYLPDKKSFVYVDRKGGEDQWRKHHTSSVTREIWKYDAATGTHTNLTNHPGEDRSPIVSPDGSTLYFLSERDGGTFNVYSAPMSDPSKLTALTDFKTHPVRFLSRGADGTLAFTYDGEIYTMRPGAKPSKVNVTITADQSNPDEITRFSSATLRVRDAAPSPDGKQLAFVRRGDVFVTSVEYPTTKQITSTPQGESGLAWGKDNRTLYYTSDRDGHFNIYRATIAREEDPNFPNATVIKEEPMFKTSDKIDRADPMISPDGKKMAFVIDRRDIAVMDLKSGKVTRLTNGNICNSRTGGLDFAWSPDSKWLAAEVDMHRRNPYYDIALINATTGEITNITNSSYSNGNPRWVMGGDAILFTSDRYGMRSQASWGSQDDAMLVFMNQAAYDNFMLSPEDFAIQKELKEARKKKEAAAAKKDSTKDGEKSKAADSKKEATADSKDLNIELDGISDRIVRLTPFSSDLSDVYIDDKGETLWFLSAFDKGYDLWKKNLRKGDVSLAQKLGSTGMAMIPDAEGKNLFLLGASSMSKMNLANGKSEKITASGTHKYNPAAERDYLFDYILKEEDKRFFDPNMHGVDWKKMGEAYRKFLPHINHNAEFAEMASELLGELNVSHTGGRYSGEPARETTASIGVLFDLTYPGPGLKVGEILAKGPFDHADSRMKAGAIVTAINGQTIGSDADYTPLFNGIAGKKTLVSFTLPTGEKEEEVILPVNRVTDLLYDRWVKRNAHIVDSLSGGRLGYVHLRQMNDASYRTIYADLLGKYNEREGIVIDTRFNGGGRLHEDIEVLFSGKKYLTQEIKGVVAGEMPSRRWNKPSIMLTGEANYSNAHGTPWVYRHVGLGKTVGMPVPGTMSSVNWVTMQDPQLVFGIPVVGFKTAEGNYLENTQLEPNVKVANDPAKIVLGIDDQIAAAVATLLNDIDKK